MENTAAKQSGWFRFVSRYGVLLLMVLVALNHFRLRADGISSWKGGGFGMYAEMHPVYNKLFVKSRLPLEEARPKGSTDRASKIMSKAQMYPGNHFLQQLKDEYWQLYGENDYRVQVWMPVFQADSCLFHLELKKTQ